MDKVAFRLTSNSDPEERLEEAALFKAFFDYYGSERLVVVHDNEPLQPEIPMFGRSSRFAVQDVSRETDGQQITYISHINPVSSHLPYWSDPAFLAHNNRSFTVSEYGDVDTHINTLHAAGKSAFLKSTRSKHYIETIHPGESFSEKIGSMAYSFIDGPALMVQEYCDVIFEHRFFVVNRQIVTQSPIYPSLTPLDFPMKRGSLVRSPRGPFDPVIDLSVYEALEGLANEIASTMIPEHASVDLAIINGKPAIVEMNPMQIGNLGLFACDVRALAAASEKLVAGFVPPSVSLSPPSDYEEDYSDDIDSGVHPG